MIHILYTGCAKIKKIIMALKVESLSINIELARKSIYQIVLTVYN